MNKPNAPTNAMTAILTALALCGTIATTIPALAVEAGSASAATDTEQQAAAEPATEQAAEPAVEQAAAEPATEQAATEPAVEQAAEPATEQVAAETATATPEEEEQSYTRRSDTYRTELNRRIAEMKEAARLRRENMERWRSLRRWWNNPIAEERRQWNRARAQWYRDMAEARRKYDEQQRPDYSYRYWYAYP
jgi:hypothetical protein